LDVEERLMVDAVTENDPRYGEIFDMRKEALASDGLVDADITALYSALRAKGAVQRGALHEHIGVSQGAAHYSISREGYTCFSFAACNEAFRDNETFSSQQYREIPAIQALGKTIIEMGGIEHRQYRGAMQPMFLKPQTLTWWRHRWIDEIVESLIESLRGRSHAELNLQFCARLPMHVVSRGVGIDGAEALDFRDCLMKMTGISHVTPAERGQAAAQVERMLLELIAKRRVEPGDDVVSGMLAAEIEMEDGSRRRLSDAEIMANCRLIILAGGGTTWRQLGITLWALLSNPDQLEDLKSDRRLVAPAIEESLRWNPTDPVFSRVVTVDTVLQGASLPAGARLDICIGAGNRDPDRWDDPDRYDLHRPPKSHLGFSVGPHQCLGMNVARSEMSLAINALLDNFPRMRADPDAPMPDLLGTLEQRAMTAVPVRLD
jgi:cytochrome P450